MYKLISLITFSMQFRVNHFLITFYRVYAWDLTDLGNGYRLHVIVYQFLWLADI